MSPSSYSLTFVGQSLIKEDVLSSEERDFRDVVALIPQPCALRDIGHGGAQRLDLLRLRRASGLGTLERGNALRQSLVLGQEFGFGFRGHRIPSLATFRGSGGLLPCAG